MTANAAPPPRSFPMTYALIAINIAIYAWVSLNGGLSYENLIRFGAKETGLIAEGQVARLFVPMFLHAGLLHLVVNMYGLHQIGRVLEMLIGTRSFLVVYLVAGISGNLCSFAFSPALSVGASGSLFGILLCLYVWQKYEEKLAKELDLAPVRTGLGGIIVINAVISFLIPMIDWASHLGGAVAGAFLGLAGVARFDWNRRQRVSMRYLHPGERVRTPPPWRHPMAYQIGLALVMAAMALTYVRVGLAQRAFGLGVLDAANTESDPRSPDMLPQFRELLAAPKSETNPSALFSAIVGIHQDGHVLAATRGYEVVRQLYEHGIGDEQFLSEGTSELLARAGSFAAAGELPPTEVLLALDLAEQPKAPSKPSAHACSGPAALLRTLGFYTLSAKLYECAFFMESGSLPQAAAAVATYWLGKDQRELQIFLARVETLDKRRPRPLVDRILGRPPSHLDLPAPQETPPSKEGLDLMDSLMPETDREPI